MAIIKNEIYVGSLENLQFVFQNDAILSCPNVQSVALVGQEMSMDTFSPVVKDSEDALNDIYRFRSSDDMEITLAGGVTYALDVTPTVAYSNDQNAITNIQDGTPVWYYHNNELVGKFYVESVDRIARNRFRLNCTSFIGLLEKTYHGGGLFLSTTFGAVLEHIMASGLHGDGSAIVDYVIDDDVAELPVSGWLPYATKRQNLYQLIFANGVNIVRNIDGNPRFTFLYTGETAEDNAPEIQRGDIFDAGSVEYEKPYSAVEVAEHTYTAVSDVDSVVLFDNTTGAQYFNQEIWFDQAPVVVSSLAATGNLTLVSATENSAVVSGNGILSGKPYTHSTRIVSETNSSGASGKVIHVSDCTMVNAINSENLLNRLFAFYCPATTIRKIRNSIVRTDQRCGKLYKITTPYGETETALLATMDSNASSFLRADCEFYADYSPAGQAGLYSHVVIITPEWDEENQQWVYTGTWTVPEDVTEFKVVLIGGGTGGASGLPGHTGQSAESYTDMDATADLSGVWYGGEGGEGGEAGSGGGPGRVKIDTYEGVTAGDSYSFSLGQGGSGGGPTSGSSHVSGTAGTATTFSDGTTTISTADNDGYLPTGGVYEPITDQYFALPGLPGIAGGKGGARQVKSGSMFTWVTDGEDVTDRDGNTYHGGRTGSSMTSIPDLSEVSLIAYGGNGAGAAVGIDRSSNSGINGKSDQSAFWEVVEVEEEGEP